MGDDVKAGDDQSIDTNDAGIDDNDTDELVMMLMLIGTLIISVVRVVVTVTMT